MTKPQQPQQYDLLSETLNAYRAADRPVDNQYLYRAVAQRASLTAQQTQECQPIGTSGAARNVYKRRLRWHQQTLRDMGLLKRTQGKRGVWELTDQAKRGLHPIRRPMSLVAFSTDTGVAIWGYGQDVFGQWPSNEPIMLALTSPPYPLASARRYGNPAPSEMVGFLLEILAPIVERLAPEGSVVLNLSQDIFMPQSPARSTYIERVVIALEDQLGLSLMDRIPWVNSSKPPGPIRYASGTRQQLNVGWEPVLWFAKDPLRCKADNRRVLAPHSRRQQRLIAQGGEQRHTNYGDGAYRITPGAYATATQGAIPKNVLQMGHSCPVGRKHRQQCIEHGLPTHGAGMPYRLPEFLISFLTEEGDLVADFCGGRGMTGKAAQALNRNWVTTECMAEYVAGGALLFQDEPGFAMNPSFKSVFQDSI